jgi:hypothetical protein
MTRAAVWILAAAVGAAAPAAVVVAARPQAIDAATLAKIRDVRELEKWGIADAHKGRWAVAATRDDPLPHKSPTAGGGGRRP